MDETLRSRVELAVYLGVNRLRELAPKDTGNLAYNSIRLVRVDKDTFKIYVDEAIAPYMPYTNEPWVSPRWNGKKNPNEKWFDKAAKIVAQEIADAIGGEI